MTEDLITKYLFKFREENVFPGFFQHQLKRVIRMSVQTAREDFQPIIAIPADGQPYRSVLDGAKFLIAKNIFQLAA